MLLRYVTAVTLAALTLLLTTACAYEAPRAPEGNPLDGDYGEGVAPAVTPSADRASRSAPTGAAGGDTSLERATDATMNPPDRPSLPEPDGPRPRAEQDAVASAPPTTADAPTAALDSEPAARIAEFVDVEPQRGAPALPPPDLPAPTVPTPAADASGVAAPPRASVGPSDRPPSHEAFDELLNKYVDARGGVDYAGLQTEHAKLNSYLASLAEEAPTEAWSRDARLAYWINAYNAATLDLILDHYPLRSIKDLDGGNPWDVPRVRLGGQTYSLNAIENEVIRPRFREPRIHFAVNCAAEGCPPLRNEAYRAERLDAQLTEQTRRYLTDDAYTRLEGDALRVSRIFDWYGEDFGDVAAFVRAYRDDVPAGATVTFSEYDWALNER